MFLDKPKVPSQPTATPWPAWPTSHRSRAVLYEDHGQCQGQRGRRGHVLCRLLQAGIGWQEDWTRRSAEVVRGGADRLGEVARLVAISIEIHCHGSPGEPNKFAL